MLKQLKIENFRCFESFEIKNFGIVNLIVGKNNSGKTTILEAIRLFNCNDILFTLKEILEAREEVIGDRQKINISHIFYNYGFEFESKDLTIASITNNKIEYIGLDINKNRDEDKYQEINEKLKKLLKDIDNRELESYKNEFINIVKYHLKSERFREIPLIYDLSLGGEVIKKLDFYFDGDMPLKLIVTNNSNVLKTKFISSSSLNISQSLELFNQIVLTPEEDLVYQALQIIEPNIERIAPIGNEIKNNNSRSGFFVRLKDTQKRVPIGSMGDGIWRMLGLSLALVSAKDGVLLVDEIDTGLHYTALENMWKLIWETSKKLNVQVFATTHNSDCWKALEVLTNREDVTEEDISIQRIEKDATKSVVYNKKGIAIAAKRDIEVR